MTINRAKIGSLIRTIDMVQCANFAPSFNIWNNFCKHCYRCVTSVLSRSACREKIPNLQCTLLYVEACTEHTRQMVHTYSTKTPLPFKKSNDNMLSTLGSRYDSMASGGLNELGWFHVHLGSNNGAFVPHVHFAVCYKLDQSSFTLPPEGKEIHMEAPGLGMLFNTGQEGSEIKGFYAGWMREHVTDEQRHQRVIWGYITVPARPPSDTPYCCS